MCACSTVGHDVCETMGAGVTVYADFVNGVIDSLLVGCQHRVMPATKPAEVYLVHVYFGLSDVFFWGGEGRST